VAIDIRCECGNVLHIPDEHAGRRARCPVCQRELVIPERKHRPDDELGDFHDYPPSQTSGKAIASLILGLCSFVACCITGIPAVIFGLLGLGDINNPKKRLTGGWMAVTGIVLGTFGTAAVVLIALLLPAVQAAREAARRAQCVNNMKIIGLAMHNYHSARATFPPAAQYDPDGKPLLSWRVLILPYLDQQSLYDQFHLDEPWDSPHNRPLADQMPAVFRCLSEPTTQGMTTYEVVVDPSSMFTGKSPGVSISSVTDGTSMTILVVESANPVPWTKPDDLSLQSTAPLFGVGSKHPGGMNALMGDGSVRFIRTSGNSSIGLQTLRAMFTRNGGEVVPAQ
jgi:prepilin-type processing-associated H-X9-DG protein